jgi:hypothetical protein
MKTTACVLALAAILPSLRASDVSDLASGYSSAFAAMDRLTCNIVCIESGQSTIIKDVKLVRAFGGALLIRQSNGNQMVISAGSVVRMTE